MTPSLAGFIATGEDRQAWEDSLDAALTAVATEFAVVRERGGEASGSPAGGSPAGGDPVGVRRRTWLDTFDWRLHKAGLTLEYVAGHRGGELRLASATSAATSAATGGDTGGDTGAVQPVTGWQATRPHLPSDLPDGPVTARIVGLVAPRALLPVVTVTGTATGYRLLNSDDKTVARLLIEHAAIPGGSSLAPRLTITGVRGYQVQARRAARLVAGVPGVKRAVDPPFAAALRVLGRRPGDYSNKIDAPITARMPASRAAAVVLLRLLDTMEANVGGVLRDTDTEFLHDLRVSVRRTRSALKLFGDVLGLPRADLAFFAAEFKWVGDVTTPTRDLDVHLLDFAQMADGLAAAKPDDLEPFRGYLEQRRRKEFRTLTRAVRSARFTAATRDWRAKLTAIEHSSKGAAGVATARSEKAEQAPPETGTVGTLAAERTRVCFVRVARRGAAITAGSPPESLHDLRKRCKELRYALEFFAPLHDPAGYGKVVGDLKRLQDCLGEFQDTDVQIGEIRALASAMLAAGEAPAVTLLAMGEVTAGLVVRQQAARADFERRFAAFADVDGQRRMSVLLRGRQAGAGRYP
jgi:CHAD domain-containing protein